jgi:hypothetical protein
VEVVQLAIHLVVALEQMHLALELVAQLYEALELMQPLI